MGTYTWAVVLGLFYGFLSRLTMLKTDFRQYPTYHHGKVIHLSLGFIAAALGALAVPALLEKNYTAVTFLALAAQQFRDVRNMERETLSRLDQNELVPRGSAYIENIAMIFESRNYIVIFTALFVSLVTVSIEKTWGTVWGTLLGFISGGMLLLINQKMLSAYHVEDLADVTIGNVDVHQSDIWVDGIYIMNVGLRANQEIIKARAVGIVIHPHDLTAQVTLSHLGQRQAILHDASTILGVYRDTGEPALVPLIKRNLTDGRIGVFLLPEEKDLEKARRIVAKVAILESALRLPMKASARQRVH